MTAITKLEIAGFAGKPLPNRFFRQEQDAARLGIVLPGLGYNSDMPLLYYPAKLLVERGADLLQLRPDYNTQEFLSLSGEERARRAFADATAALHAGLAERRYQHVTLVGKSIGTMALAHLLATEARLAGAVTVWLTPLLRIPQVAEVASRFPGPALYVAGTADPNFDADVMARVQQATGAHTLIVPDADHSMEIRGDLLRSVGVLQQIVHAIAGFLDRR
jgi:hypothetical protein